MLRADSLSAAVGLAEQESGEIFVIGGSGLLREALPMASTVYETVVHTVIEGDTFVDPFDFASWRTDVLEEHPADGAHSHGFTIYRHARELPHPNKSNSIRTP